MKSEYTVLTNGHRADLIDALEVAIEDRETMIDSNLRKDPKHDSGQDSADRAEWTGQIKRFREMRQFLHAEENKAMPQKYKRKRGKGAGSAAPAAHDEGDTR